MNPEITTELQPQWVCFHPVAHDSDQPRAGVISSCSVLGPALIHRELLREQLRPCLKTITSGQQHRSQRFWTRYLATTTQHHLMWWFSRGGNLCRDLQRWKRKSLNSAGSACQRTEWLEKNKDVSSLQLLRPHTFWEIIWSHVYHHQTRSPFEFFTLKDQTGMKGGHFSPTI